MTLKHSELLGAVAHAAKIVGKSTVKVMQGILIESGNWTLTLTAVSAEAYITRVIPCDGEIESCIVDAALLLKSIESIKADTVTFTSGKQLEVKGGGSKFNLSIIGDDSDFPTFPTFEPGGNATVSASLIEQLLSEVGSAVAGSDEKRVALTGVCLESMDGKLTAGATDTVAVCANVYDAEGIDGVIRPSDLSKILAFGWETIDIQWNNSWVRVENGGDSLMFQKIGDSFPNYRKPIPAESERTVTWTTSALKDALASAAAVGVNLKDGSYKVVIEVADGLATLSMKGTESDSVISIPVDTDATIEPFAVSWFALRTLIGAAGTPTMTTHHKGSRDKILVVRGDSWRAALAPMAL